MLTDLRLDHAGIAGLLTSGQFQPLVTGAADEIAGEVAAQVGPDVEVVVDEYVTDRTAASVTIRDPRGAIYQARDGVLTRAAAAVGLEVTEKG